MNAYVNTLRSMTNEELKALWRARYRTAEAAALDKEAFGLILFTEVHTRGLLRWAGRGLYLVEDM